ncbi:hypothetical protein ILUMI_07125 [Ignelater luminosus]|uniref:DUF4817 domain-containing protein n=1 Tax=Ignelater luminosus TaxID=2038154 RepID=A0A8K0D8P4_IGNLU|nr:hypothetical protein ILUMI_07125 [Ignelater luminosus]
MHTAEKKVQIVTWYNSELSLNAVFDLLANSYPERPTPNPSSISRIFLKFRRHGCVDTNHHKRRRTKPIRNEEIGNLLVHRIEENNPLSTRRLALELSISETSVFRLLKDEKFYSYHIQNH